VTSSERFQLLIGALGLLFVILTAGLGLIVRITIRWTKIESSLSVIADKIKDIVTGKDADHRDLEQQINKVDSRIERHEVWHDDHPYMSHSEH
jgi:hypothetical protein